MPHSSNGSHDIEDASEYDESMSIADSSASSHSSSASFDKTAQCIRSVANFSQVKSFHLMEKKDFNPEILNLYLHEAAPKLEALFEQIERLDVKDMRTHGKHFKHMIFTDMDKGSYGAKLIASAFVAKGFQPAFHVQGTGFTLYNDDRLLESKGHNFGVLMSKTFFERSMNVKFRKHNLELFNRRPDNVHGDLMRFIILDQGFKEGIDLFDVKYVHLFEPLVVQADEKQAIGRGTRFCGQKGLEFHPRFGWPLYVFRYEVAIPKHLQPRFDDSKQLFDLFLRYSNLDLRKVVFAAELDKAAVEAAVDRELTHPVHQFSIELPPPALSGGARELRSSKPYPPSRIMPLDAMHRYISNGFKRFQYPEVKLQNNCVNGGGAASATGNIVQFSPTQDFVRHYFQTSSAYKGMLFYHGVGCGKTCGAIATATTSFERDGYTILWVTRHTLKSDIWKNMYGQVCSLVIQDQLKDKSLKLPQKISGPMKYVSDRWMEPISYKQFSNMLLKKNKIYDQIVARNGTNDPLRKTLVIIDEAHKLYSPTVAASEKPNTDILEKMVQNSYDKSGKDSVRILLMTATPYTEDGMEMIKLLNLLRKKDDQLPSEFDDFRKKYLDDNGYFTKTGLKRYKDEISGYISYLNRSQDARNFAHPVLEDVVVPLTEREEEKDGDVEKKVDKHVTMMKELRIKIRETRSKMREAKSASKDVERGMKTQMRSKAKDCKETVLRAKQEEIETVKHKKEMGMNDCADKPVKERRQCKEKTMAMYHAKTEEIKLQKAKELAECADIMGDMSEQSIAAKNKELFQEIEDLEKSLGADKEELEKLKEVMKGKREERAQMRAEMKGLTAHLKELKPVVKKLATKVAKERANIKKIKDKGERRKAQLELRANLVADLKEVKREVIEARAKVVGIRLARKLMSIADGKGSLGDVSQASALQKRCKI